MPPYFAASCRLILVRPMSTRSSKTIIYAVVGVTVVLVTLLIFPAISYLSVGFYGLPAAVFVAFGFAIWIILRRYSPGVANVFGVAFSAPVIFCLVPMFFTAVPYLPLLIVAPTAILWFIASRKGLTRRCSEPLAAPRSGLR